MKLKKKINTESFSRYEFKYLLPLKKAAQIEKEIKNFMFLDKNASKNKKKNYFVRSLYFDNEINSNFYEKVDGMETRKKFRIRVYSANEKSKSPIFLEMKGRRNQRTYKLRTEIDKNHLHYLLNNENLDSLSKAYNGQNHVIDNFIYDTLKKKIKPKILVDYDRRAYFNKSGLLFRLTFDNNILSSPSKELFNKKFLNFKETRAGYTVLELKFERSIQPWFHRIIQNYNLTRMSISKFAIGMEKSGFGHETSN
jgi:hypothetical protein